GRGRPGTGQTKGKPLICGKLASATKDNRVQTPRPDPGHPSRSRTAAGPRPGVPRAVGRHLRPRAPDARDRPARALDRQRPDVLARPSLSGRYASVARSTFAPQTTSRT